MISSYAIFTKSGELNLKNLNPCTYYTHHISQRIIANNPLVAYTNVYFYALSNAHERIFLSVCQFPTFQHAGTGCCRVLVRVFLTPYLQQLLDKDRFLAGLLNKQTTSEKWFRKDYITRVPLPKQSICACFFLTRCTYMFVSAAVFALTNRTDQLTKHVTQIRNVSFSPQTDGTIFNIKEFSYTAKAVIASLR